MTRITRCRFRKWLLTSHGFDCRAGVVLRIGYLLIPLHLHGFHVTETPQDRERATTILVAEDDDALRGIVTRVFWDQGYRTLEARHGGEALHLAELAAPYLDLVVTDVVMPEVDGLELGRRLAQRWAAIPILYISAYPPNDIFGRGGPAAPTPFLQKPFTAEVLLAKVRELLSGAKRS